MIHHDSFHNDDSGSHFHFSKDGTFKGTSMKNIFGGKDYFDSHGQLKGFTFKNFFGGHDYFGSDGHLHGSTIPSLGKLNFIDTNGNLHHHGPEFLHSNHIHSMRMDLLNKIR
jgi:hypothetical protein